MNAESVQQNKFVIKQDGVCKEEGGEPPKERARERQEERVERQNQFNQKPSLGVSSCEESSSRFLDCCSPHPQRDPSILTPPPLNTNTHTHTHSETDTGTVWSVEPAERDSPMSKHLPTIQHLPVPVTQGCKSFDTLLPQTHTLSVFSFPVV